MKNLNRIFSGLIFSTIALLAIAGCKNDGEIIDNLQERVDGNSTITSPQEKVFLSEAELDDIAEHITDCNGNSGKICVTICHRPPGNPQNSHTKVLFLKASLAHLNHGADHHEDRDYLGYCHLDDSDPNDEGDNGDDSDNDDEGDNGDNGDNEVPPWCEDVMDIDADCDGFVDDTGEPLF